MTVPMRVPSGVHPVPPASAEALVDVVCPGCGTVGRVRSDRRSASDFCARCDQPLFWAGTARSGESSSTDDSLDAHFRAPGVVGTAQHGALACPSCGEGNHPTWSSCVRCGAPLDPPPPPPVLPPPAPAPAQVVTVERLVPCGHPRTWVVALVSALLASALTATVFLLVR